MSAKFAKYWFVIKVSLTAQLSYFWDLAGRSLFFVLILLIFHQLWGATLEDAASDLSRNQLIWYLVAAEVIMLSTPSGRGLNVDEDIKSGNIAYLLNRPCSYPLFMFGRYWGEALASLLVNAIIGSLTALALVGAPSLKPRCPAGPLDTADFSGVPEVFPLPNNFPDRLLGGRKRSLPLDIREIVVHHRRPLHPPRVFSWLAAAGVQGTALPLNTLCPCPHAGRLGSQPLFLNPGQPSSVAGGSSNTGSACFPKGGEKT